MLQENEKTAELIREIDKLIRKVYAYDTMLGKLDEIEDETIRPISSIYTRTIKTVRARAADQLIDKKHEAGIATSVALDISPILVSTEDLARAKTVQLWTRDTHEPLFITDLVPIFGSYYVGISLSNMRDRSLSIFETIVFGRENVYAFIRFDKGSFVF